MNYKFLPHTADVKFQAFGDSLENCFKNASYALKEIISKDKVKNIVKKSISVEGKDKEALLYNFLEEFLFLFETEHFLLGRISKIEVKDKGKSFELNAEALGDDSKKYEIDNHVKAITYNDMFVAIEKHKYSCQVVVDV